MSNEVESADKISHLLLQRAASDTELLTEVANKIGDEAIDVRQLFESTIQSAQHKGTRDLVQNITCTYEKTLGLLLSIAEFAKALDKEFKDAKYLERLEFARSKVESGQIDRKSIVKLIRSSADIQHRMMSRQFYWAFFLINFRDFIKGLDGAQAMLLERESLSAQYKDVLVEGVLAAAEQCFTGFSLLVAIAKSQEPPLDKLLAKMQQANTILDKLYGFEEILRNQIEVGNHAAALISLAGENELKSKDDFDAAFGKHTPS